MVLVAQVHTTYSTCTEHALQTKDIVSTLCWALPLAYTIPLAFCPTSYPICTLAVLLSLSFLPLHVRVRHLPFVQYTWKPQKRVGKTYLSSVPVAHPFISTVS